MAELCSSMREMHNGMLRADSVRVEIIFDGKKKEVRVARSGPFPAVNPSPAARCGASNNGDQGKMKKPFILWLFSLTFRSADEETGRGKNNKFQRAALMASLVGAAWCLFRRENREKYSR